MASDGQPRASPPRASSPAAAPQDGKPTRRRRARLARGPIVIGEPAPAVEPRLAAGDPYRADTVIDGGSVFGLTVRAASVRGLGKRFTGGPRQDDVCLGRHERSRSLIAAVADGVSGAAQSHLGAALAVRQAVAAVERQLERRQEIDWQEVFKHAAWALLEAHRSRSGDAHAGVDAAGAALASTLLVAVVGPSQDPPAATTQVQLACVGDSPALMLAGRRFHALLGEQQDRQALIGGSVQALPRDSANVCSSCCRLQRGAVLLLCTDGFSLPLAGGESEVGAVFARELARPPDIVDFARLLDFSRSTYDDDRSLIAIWPPSQS